MDIVSWSKGHDSRPPQIGGPSQKFVKPWERKNRISSKNVQIYKIFFPIKVCAKWGLGKRVGGGAFFSTLALKMWIQSLLHVSCAFMLMPIIIFVTTFTISWMVHHIQTKTYSPTTSRNPSPKIKNKTLA